MLPPGWVSPALAKKPPKTNSSLHKARDAKNDEFYTQLADIERELKHYTQHFKGKVVYCNCDDPRVSNFFHYFSHNFEKLGLKKLIATCYKNKDIDLFSRNDSEQAICLEYSGDKNGNKVPDLDEIGIKHLKGDGDFRSEESIQLLKEADIVVTNPPFSLFREYLAQLIEHEKSFLIIGNINAISYKECFQLIKENKMWLGYNCARHFKRPDGSMFETARTFWFTNLDISKRHEDLDLYKAYTEGEYPHYENYDAINVDVTKHIPADYAGPMGVPITFLDKYNPDQFDIIGQTHSGDNSKEVEALRKDPNHRHGGIVKGASKEKYARILIKHKRL